MKGYTEKDHAFVVCAYQESPYLEECLLSLLAQSRKSSIYLATSTPTDFLAKLCEKYALPLYLNQGNSHGIAEDWNFAYNCALQEGKKLLTLAHQDDIYEARYLETVLKRVNIAKAPLLIFTDYYEIRAGQQVQTNSLLRIKRLMNFPLRLRWFWRSRAMRRFILSFGDSICCPSVTFVAKRLTPPLFDSRFRVSCDYKAWVDLSRQPGSFVYCPQRLLGHRIYSESTTSANISDDNRKKEDYEILSQCWPKFLAKFIFLFYRKAEKSNEL
jgi:hypothetical protein